MSPLSLITFQGGGHHTSEKVETHARKPPWHPRPRPPPPPPASVRPLTARCRLRAAVPPSRPRLWARCWLPPPLLLRSVAFPVALFSDTHSLPCSAGPHPPAGLCVFKQTLQDPASVCHHAGPPPGCPGPPSPPPHPLLAECPHHHVGAALVWDLSYLCATDAISGLAWTGRNTPRISQSSPGPTRALQGQMLISSLRLPYDTHSHLASRVFWPARLLSCLAGWSACPGLVSLSSAPS